MAQTSPEYGVRESEPRTGSRIRDYASKDSYIPINRKYSELTPEEKAHINQFYESIGPGDEPPFPAAGLKPIHEALVKAQEKLGVEGELILVATVGSEGDVAQVKTIGSPSPQMTKVAASILLLTKFKPAVCKGEPCKMDYPFRFVFKLK